MTELRIFVDFVMAPEVLELLREGTAGHTLVFPKTPAASVLVQAAPDAALATVDVAFGQPDPGAIAQTTQLRWVHVSSSSITRYDTPQFRARMAERGLAVSNSASVYNEACALHALSFMLAQARHLPRSLQTRTPNGSPAWHSLRGACAPLRGQTALILGFGAIGRCLVEFLRPHGMNLLAYRRTARADEGIPVVDRNSLDQVLAREADHIINILPDSAETRGFFGEARFAAVKPGAVFYNIGRGTTVDQTALVGALRSGRLSAAWLDVTDPEPLPGDHPLRHEPTCFITPHVAGGHTDEAKTLVRHFLANLKRFTKGEPLLDRVI